MKGITENNTQRRSPCLNCPDRAPGCHSEACPHGWAEYQAYCQKLRDARAYYANTWAYKSGRDKAITKLMKYKQRRSWSKRSK